MKKVVMFGSPVHEIPPLKGAAVQTWIHEVSKKILKYEIHILSISNEFLPNKEFKDGVYYYRIHLSKPYKRIFQKILGWDIYSYNKRIFKLIKEIRPNIIHIHNYYGSKEIVKWIREYDNNIKIILHMHNVSKAFDKKDFPKIDIFIGCSEFIKNYFMNKVDSNSYKVVYNGVDVNKFLYANQTKKLENSIFYVGRISPEKGVDKIVELAKLLPQYNFYCIGEISKDGKRRKFFEKLQEDSKLLNNIKFLDYVSPYKIQLLYKMAKLVIVPSRIEEAFGMIVIESMASGIPTICAYKGGMVEYLQNYQNSIVINDYDNFAKLAKIEIENILNDEKLYNFIKHNGIKTAKKFDWVNIVNKLEEIYDEMD